ncbi:respiratory nitrate reductase chaperone NarJ [Georgenia satyanarayanai]|uniref:Respiratory nitrate reductase chaperone NarJ n=1 Tax=Georgenia satyanarayanai TaxID=860221 RepID=A0A2Y9A9M4_9MICO|nr:nitrate reductase molybdenum cofactor assembly chaperone [Georgenia satyanarayanai]PYG01020.1 respiratory nitrate reductase chaperone NarJ [Georgenia satyanarayanai]SSA39259.1 respiratory nitrate reductase chaperone NarJ [Georgenia satyanarayanai]
MSGFIRAPELTPLTPVRLGDRDRAVAHMAASILLDYPTAGRLAAYATVREAVAGLPQPVRQRLWGFLDHAATAGDEALAQDYVATFDLKRKCSMYLSYFLTGDTRKRGTALVRFVEAYRAAGWEVDRPELPDFLPLVLEFSARGDAEIAGGLLGSHRQGIEVLRSALTSMSSPWAAVVEAVCLTLPPVTDEVRDRYLELITSGPPTEMVGLNALGPLEPYSPGGAAQKEVRA